MKLILATLFHGLLYGLALAMAFWMVGRITPWFDFWGSKYFFDNRVENTSNVLVKMGLVSPQKISAPCHKVRAKRAQ